MDWLGGAHLRTRCDVEATVVGMHPAPGDSVALEVLVEDPTGTIRCLFFGRRELPGVAVGTKVRVRGRVALFAGRRCLLNPGYELVVPPGAPSAVSS